MTDQTTAGLSLASFTAAAEHAGRWKAERGRAPHYATGHTQWWTCLACPLDGCEWHHDDPHAAPGEAAVLEAVVREHVAGHDLVDVLASLTAARDATDAVRASSDRAWEVVQLRRQQAIERGEHPYSDPVAQMLSAALVDAECHQAVRDQLGDIGRG
ncbi:hypothetical protein [Streptomyces sp. XY533]|uniref:hypothetical protein n=1 Tax=Streptomyces sp. XY533 TaxID=1519481 RepID=UPI0006AE11E3|nr:hypothetical protein [Streptomyces sp. XY533]KOU99090.1 hypothetical protein ADK92_12870 [Streptomyces sp. XY533]